MFSYYSPSLRLSGLLKNWITLQSPLGKFLQKILDVMEPLCRLWKGLEDIKNAADNTVPEPVEDYIKLIEQTVLLLDQALNSIL